MSKAFGGLIDYLKGSKEAVMPSTATFAELDVDQLARDLGLESRGRERAAEGSGAVDESGLDIVEREIVDDIRARARRARDEYTTQLDLYESRLRDASIGDDAFVRIKAAAEEALANFKAQVVEDKLPLDAADERVARLCRQFNVFVGRHRLHDVAPQERSGKQQAHGWLWIGVIVVIESLLNGVFFAQGSEAGLVGGITEALLLALLNIGLAAGVGLFALRYLRHAFWFWKLFAAVAFVALAGGILGLNLVIAHYREAFAFSQGVQVDFRVVMESLWARPFGLEDSRSWLLGAMGVLLNVFAIYKFYHLNDPYPGYGQLAARRESALARLAEQRRNCIEVLTLHRDAARREMTDVIELITSRRFDFELALRSRDRLHTLFKEYLGGLERATARLGQVYRQHLGEGGQRAHAGVLRAGIESPGPISSAYNGDENAHKRAIDRMDHYIDRVSQEYSAAVASVERRAHLVEVPDARA